jgi:hypothetical protein
MGKTVDKIHAVTPSLSEWLTKMTSQRIFVSYKATMTGKTKECTTEVIFSKLENRWMFCK